MNAPELPSQLANRTPQFNNSSRKETEIQSVDAVYRGNGLLEI
jgi:hypothetical protein